MPRFPMQGDAHVTRDTATTAESGCTSIHEKGVQCGMPLVSLPQRLAQELQKRSNQQRCTHHIRPVFHPNHFKYIQARAGFLDSLSHGIGTIERQR